MAISLLRKKRLQSSVRPLLVDVHSHLIPGIDDGVNSLEESIEIVRDMSALGYKKLVTTPHIMNDFYPNTPANIRAGKEELQQEIDDQGIDMEIDAAAEYYLDEHFMKLLDEKQELLTFGDNYLLFETSFLNEPAYLREGIFKMISNGMKPVLAHPERYVFIQNNPEILEDLLDRGLLLQVNTLSLTGYYSKAAKKLAEALIDEQLVSFLGSDCHNEKHLQVMRESIAQKYFIKALRLDLQNNFL